jgi:pimeloyl-ACP methyl ester carboxylesterase
MKLRGERRRDNQQWLLDWMVKTTGRVQNFALDEREVPPEAKSYRMIPRSFERRARHEAQLAQAAEEHGHYETARELYWQAAESYRGAQHAIFEDDNPEKIYLHGKLLACFEKVMQYAPHPIERIEVPWNGTFIQGVLHLLPGRPMAPTIVFCPGMDMTKEAFLNPIHHPFVERGLNCLHLDGPGQGTSNIRKIRVTSDNYEQAGSAAIDYLCQRPEVDSEKIGVSGFSMGSFWGMRLAARDRRVNAVATAAACYGPKHAIFEEASPRFKQMFMYMAGIRDEAAFDRMAAEMTLDGAAAKITCPTLQVTGEYDPLAHLEDVLAVFEKVGGPKELWVVENGFHSQRGLENFGGEQVDFFGYLANWLRDALAGNTPSDLNRRVLVRQKDGAGPYDPPIPGLLLPERLGIGVPAGQLSAAQLGPQTAGANGAVSRR